MAADWHEPLIPQRIMRSSIARSNEQIRGAATDIPPHQSATLDLHSLVPKLFRLTARFHQKRVVYATDNDRVMIFDCASNGRFAGEAVWCPLTPDRRQHASCVSFSANTDCLFRMLHAY